MMNPEQLVKAYSTGATLRYHTSPQRLHQRVDGHTWGVATLLAMAHPSPSSALLSYALFHDMGERYGPGDINYFAKIRHPALGVASEEAEAAALADLNLPPVILSESEKRWFKWADATEVALHGHRLWKDTGEPCALALLKSALAVMGDFDDLPNICWQLWNYLQWEVNEAEK